MVDQPGTMSNIVISDEGPLHTNFYFTIGNEQVFNCQIHVKGSPTPEQIEAHIKSAINAMTAVVRHGGKAKQVGQQPAANGKPADPPAPQFEFYSARGKTYFKLPEGAPEPNELTCPVHGKTMKRKTNPDGAWWSHKDGDGWCGASVGRG